MINIVTVNYHIEGEGIVNTELGGDETLLDADVVIIDPSEIAELWTEHLIARSSGIDRVSSPMSDQFRKEMASRKREIGTLLENGKVIIQFLEPICYFEGQNRGSYKYDLITNYDYLPLDPNFLLTNLKAGISSSVNSLTLFNQQHLFAPFFKAFKSAIEYASYFDIDASKEKDFFIRNRSNKPIAYSVHANNGLVVFLPRIPYSRNNKILTSTIIKCCKKFLSNHEVTPPPNWISEFDLEGELELNGEIEKVNEKIVEFEIKRTELETEKKEITKYKNLLFEQGPELESVIIEAFKLFGFKAENRAQDDLEHDIVFSSVEGKGIAEVEGKDNDAVHISKLDQLGRVVDEDFELTESYSQGILIGNHYRFKRPDDRQEAFTEKVKIVADRKKFGLLTTLELFKAVSYIFKNPDDVEFKLKCRLKILKTEGIEIKLIDV